MCPVENYTTAQVQELMKKQRPGDYQLLDVRQSWEYEEFHLPGADLLPLPDLSDSLDKVDRGKPVVVYCRSGGRSAAGAALLEGAGFDSTINMLGGVLAWQGDVAYGPVELGLAIYDPEDTAEDAIIRAYAMEENLRHFYLRRALEEESGEAKIMFTRMAGFEDKHKDTLFRIYNRLTGGKDSREAFELMTRNSAGGAVEAGVDLDQFLRDYGEAFEGLSGVVQLGMMIEAQALDYYQRCARAAEDSEAKDVFLLLAAEEKAHLVLLGKYMDDLGS